MAETPLPAAPPAEADDLYRVIVEGCADAVVVVDGNQIIRFMNRSAEEMFERRRQETVGQPIDMLIPPSFREHHRQLVRHFSEAGPPARFMRDREITIHGLRRSGEEFPIDVSILKTADSDGTRLVAIVRDISEQKELEAELKRRAEIDPLTGIFDRRAFAVRAREEMARAIRYGNPLSVAILDIDHFKTVNDTYGHLAGDRVLCQFADHVTRRLRTPDVFARWGGEEFVVLLPSVPETAAETMARRLNQSVRNTAFTGEDGTDPIAITISIGVAQLRPEIDTLDSFVDRADRAMYAAKRAGRDMVIAAAALEHPERESGPVLA